ncbi:MAG: thiolase family protein [Saprospiraceae bacterium]
MNKVYIVSAKRTPIGSFGGKLASLSATTLGSKAIKGAISAANLDTNYIDEVFFGNVCSANLGQAPARQAALGADIPFSVPCTTVNKVCSSGMKAIMFGAQSISLGQADIIVAGGMESMSNIPYYVPKMRWGNKFGGSEMIDGLQKDGLVDAYDHQAMGKSGDATAEKYGFSREDQDAYAIRSYKRAAHATESGFFKDEIVTIDIPQRKGDAIIMADDEEYKIVKFDKIPLLKPAFSKTGTVTAANASTLNDGASAIILASEEAVNKNGLTPIAEIISYADSAQEPLWFTTAPTLAAPKALKRAKLNLGDVNLFEVNEAFAAVALAFSAELDVDQDKINIHGGAVALGHPLGCSGARITTTLIHALAQRDQEIGCATLCNGGGGASAIVIKRV